MRYYHFWLAFMTAIKKSLLFSHQSNSKCIFIFNVMYFVELITKKIRCHRCVYHRKLNFHFHINNYNNSSSSTGLHPQSSAVNSSPKGYVIIVRHTKKSMKANIRQIYRFQSNLDLFKSDIYFVFSTIWLN